MSRKRTSPAVIDAALDYIEVELFQGRILRAIFRDGKTPISRSVFYRVLSDDKTIRNRIKKARRWSLEEHAECLVRGETKGNPTMTIFLLKGAAPEVYAKLRDEHGTVECGSGYSSYSTHQRGRRGIRKDVQQYG